MKRQQIARKSRFNADNSRKLQVGNAPISSGSIQAFKLHCELINALVQPIYEILVCNLKMIAAEFIF